jgi:hypothetical protein
VNWPKILNLPTNRGIVSFHNSASDILEPQKRRVKKNERIEARVEARNQAGIPTTKEELQRKEAGADGKDKEAEKEGLHSFPSSSAASEGGSPVGDWGVFLEDN